MVFSFPKHLEIPSAPRPPTDVSGMSKDSLILSWQPPEKDGGSKILDYIIEMREDSKDAWIYVDKTDGNETHIQIKKLKQKIKYTFKICARNEAGLSPPLITDEPITLGIQMSEWLLSN